MSTITVSEGYDLTGKRFAVTGASSGIGKELSRVLAMRGAQVVMACRNYPKTQRVIDELLEGLDGIPSSRFAFEECDLSSMRSVHACCRRLRERGKIDCLFLNGGVFGVPYQLTEEGVEGTYAANYLGHYLMVRSLLNSGVLMEGSRVVATISEGAYQNRFSRADLSMLIRSPEVSRSRRLAARFMSSPNSKVMMLLMMQYFNSNMGDSRIIFSGADPGFTLTDNVNQMGALMRFVAPIYTPLLTHSVEIGAANLLWLAIADEAKDAGGALLNSRFEYVALPARCNDAVTAESCWQQSERLVEDILGQPIASL